MSYKLVAFLWPGVAGIATVRVATASEHLFTLSPTKRCVPPVFHGAKPLSVLPFWFLKLTRISSLISLFLMFPSFLVTPFRLRLFPCYFFCGQGRDFWVPLFRNSWIAPDTWNSQCLKLSPCQTGIMAGGASGVVTRIRWVPVNKYYPIEARHKATPLVIAIVVIVLHLKEDTDHHHLWR